LRSFANLKAYKDQSAQQFYLRNQYEPEIVMCHLIEAGLLKLRCRLLEVEIYQTILKRKGLPTSLQAVKLASLHLTDEQKLPQECSLVAAKIVATDSHLLRVKAKTKLLAIKKERVS